MNISLNWYNQNTYRRYPVDDTASAVADNGAALPNWVVVDASLRFPAALGSRLFISSASVSPHLTTVTLLAFNGSVYENPAPPAFTPVATIAVTDPVPYRPYPVTALVTGVAGWLVFGPPPSDARPASWTFARPAQSAIVPRAALSYAQEGVTGIQPVGTGNMLSGVVKLEVAGDVTVTSAQRNVNGHSTTVILLQLADDGSGQLLTEYAGPCAARPENGNCPLPPLNSLGGAAPGCDGNLEIQFKQRDVDGNLVDTDLMVLYGVAQNDRGQPDGTLIVDFLAGLTESCPASESSVGDMTPLIPDTESSLVLNHPPSELF